MSVIGEVVGIVACVAAVISAYNDGSQIIQKLKVKRAARRAPAPPRLLEETIDQAPEAIEKEKQRGIARFGKAFETGDHIAEIALLQITVQLQGTLLVKLKNDENEDTDFLYLADAADSGRDRTITALLELRQRLLAGRPIVEVQGPVGQVFEEPQIQASPQSSDLPLRLARQTSPRAIPAAQPAPLPQQSRTWSRQLSTSVETPNNPDATPGADENIQASRRKRTSLAGIFKLHRSHSGSKDQSARPDKVLHSANSPAGSPSTGILERSATRKESVAAQPSFQYQEWEDDPAQIWGAKEESERRQTTTPNAFASPEDHPSPTLTKRSLSSASPSFVGCAPTHVGASAAPTPTPENEYLGFCKSAWKLQNGDRKAMQRVKEFNDFSRSAWQPDIFYLSCASSKCAFAGHINTTKIWEKVWTVETKGLKFRWPFLAKSHVPQQKVKDHQYGYRCLFCVFLEHSSPVYFGTDTYLEHVSSTHRGQALSEVVLYRTKGVADRVAENTEEFDINLFPLDVQEIGKRKASTVLSGDLLGVGPSKVSEDAKDSVHSNEPWNEGLSEFHWADRAELE